MPTPLILKWDSGGMGYSYWIVRGQTAHELCPIEPRERPVAELLDKDLSVVDPDELDGPAAVEMMNVQ